MSRIQLGIFCGLIFGGVDTAMMIPLSFPDKRAAMLGAFIARFALGFVICNIRLPWPGWAVGLLLGILLSLPDAIITKAIGPILASGAIGGLIIGRIAGKYGRENQQDMRQVTQLLNPQKRFCTLQNPKRPSHFPHMPGTRWWFAASS
jgi:hypothetical protein